MDPTEEARTDRNEPHFRRKICHKQPLRTIIYRLTIYRDTIYTPDMESSLSQSEFYILLSLAIKRRHGYEIMKQVEADSGRKVLLGPGTLYGAIKRLLRSGLISEAAGDNPRRRYYELTELGRSSLSSELARYDAAVELAKRQNLFRNLGLIRLAG